MICRRQVPVAVGLAANARVRRPHRVQMPAITDRALLAARPPPRSTRWLNRPRPARAVQRWGRRKSPPVIKKQAAPDLGILRTHETGPDRARKGSARPAAGPGAAARLYRTCRCEYASSTRNGP